jgi:hypothetical protein
VNTRWGRMAQGSLVVIVGVASMVLMPGSASTAASTRAPRTNTAGCGTAFSLMPAVDRDAPARLDGVAGISQSNVWAVGSASRPDGSHRGWILHWNGSAWKEMATPTPAGADALLKDVVALSANNVWAVGRTEKGALASSQTLILHWNGTKWSVKASPSPGTSGQLDAITALSANDIWAVGAYTDGGHRHTLALHWNGSSWNQTTSQDQGGDATLTEVDGTSTSNLWAGGYSGVIVASPLVERWDGAAWVVHSAPQMAFVSALAVLSPTKVWAAGGQNHGSGLVARWNGTTWTDIPTDPGIEEPQFSDLEAIAKDDIWVAGRQGHSAPDYRPLLEHWNGAKWTATATPVAPVFVAGLESIDSSAGGLWTVGHTSASDTEDRPLALRRAAGRWATTPVASRTKLDTVLRGVAATSATDAWAVGYFQPLPARAVLDPEAPFIEHWNGTKWSIVRAPYVSLGGSLTGVVALGPKNAWAVGYALKRSSPSDPLVMHWNGKRWVEVPVPSGTTSTRLQDIVAVSTSDIWAVGYQLDGDQVKQPFALHRVGGSWLEESPPPAASGVDLNGVDATGPGNVIAVGTDDGSSATVVVRWNGSAWSTQGSESFSDSDVLSDVDVGSNGSWAVGKLYELEADAFRTLIEKQGPGAWTRVASPSVGASDNDLRGVDRVASTDVWAVGRFDNESTRSFRNLIVHRTTGAWSRVTAPNAGAAGDSNALNGLDALPTGSVFAVGTYTTATGVHALALRACGI